MNSSSTALQISFPSKTIGGIHVILLAVGLAIDTIVAGFTFVYVFGYDAYVTYLSNADQSLMAFSAVLYYIILITFFIWLVSVHGALRRKYSDYPITSVGAIVRMLPLVSIWGLGSTFSSIGSYLYRKRSTARSARLVHRMILPLYIAVFIGNFVNRLLLRNPMEASNGLVLTGALFDAAPLAVFLILTITIRNAIREIYNGTGTAEATEITEEAANPTADVAALPLTVGSAAEEKM